MRDGAGVPELPVVLINFNTTEQTVRCLESLSSIPGAGSLWILDNSTLTSEAELLRREGAHWSERVRFISSERNLGFAAGSNLLVDSVMRETDSDHVLLLNNDMVASPHSVATLLQAANEDANAGLVGGRVHQLDNPDCPDSLGITLYSCLMASNRKETADPYLGPTGGCMLLSRAFINDVIASTGYLFDPEYFCYCEDTDLVLRARLLGYEPAYVDTLLALHEGQASSGSRFNPFIAYHGLRNAIWTFVKCMPRTVIIRRGPHFLLANLMSIARFMATGQWRLLYRIYRDAILGLPRCWKQRQKIMAAKRISGSQLMKVISGKFYETGYITSAVRRIVSGK